MLLDCDGIVSTSFKTVIICYHHALFATNHAYSCNDIAAGDAFVGFEILVTGKLTDLQEWAALIEHLVDSLSGKELVPLYGGLSLALADIKSRGDDVVQLLVQRLHLLIVLLEIAGESVHFGTNYFHVALV